MPEIKNTFLKGKMNKDLDARLIPNGEYVDAQNIHITKSDGSDVGVIQNIKGNELASGSITDVGTVIGYYAEQEAQNDGSNRIFYFVAGNSASNHGIYYYNTKATSNNPKIIVSGAFLNFNVNNLITGINLIDDLLFWTDNNNQPRKINVATATANPSYYNNEIKIAVAKYYPYSAPELLNGAESGMQVGTTTAIGSTSGSSTSVTLTATNNNIFIGQTVTGAGVPNDTLVANISGTTLTLSKAANLSSITLTFESNKNYLEERFVRFAYRFKFKDGEYSLISPFTQHCFIPKTYNNSVGLTIAQEKEAFKSTELESMINDVVQANLKITLPSANVYNDYEIDKIEILYKESDSVAIKSVAFESLASHSSSTYTYTYKSNLPYKTLPEDQTTRVYDNVPIRAKAQEITGNRLIYGNFEQNYNLPNINFTASFLNKSTSITTQYPYHTVKQRRVYQVGVVLSDIHGRQSSVILPTDRQKSIITIPAEDDQFDSQNWNGFALRVTFDNQIPNEYDAANNKLGWYSWKIVVKQTQQEYYNVYSPLSVDGFPNVSTPLASGVSGQTYEDADKRTWVTLHGDNINKVPKDITDNTTKEEINGSSTNLYPKIINSNVATGMSNGSLLDVVSVGTYKDHGLIQADSSNNNPLEPYKGFYQSSKNLLAAELKNGFGGIDASGSGTFNSGTEGLSVFETAPIESVLNIYYETSTSGLVSDLNAEIVSGGSGPTDILIDGGTTDSFAENVSVPFEIGTITATGGATPVSFTLDSVYAASASGTNIASKFDIVNQSGTYKLRVTSSTFYYGTSGDAYTVNITANDNNNVTYQDNVVISLTNTTPTLTLSSSATSTHYSTDNIIATASAVNGSHDSSQNTLGLTFSIQSVFLDPTGVNTNVTSSNLFTIGSTNGQLKNSNYFAQNTIGNVYRATIRVTDTGGLYTEATVDIEITPHTLVNKYYGTFSGVCTTSNFQNFYLVKTSTSTSDGIAVGDFIYETYSSGSLSNAYGGHIKTSLSGGANGNGQFARLVGGNPGEVMQIDIDCP